MGLIDTNIVMRWLLEDHKEQTVLARKVIISASPGSLIISPVVLGEVVYVLRSKNYSNIQITIAVTSLQQIESIKFESGELLKDILKLLKTNLDFADCYLITRALREKQQFHTFDKKALRTYLALKAC